MGPLRSDVSHFKVLFIERVGLVCSDLYPPYTIPYRARARDNTWDEGLNERV